METQTLFTIGHSNQPVEHLIDLLRQYDIEVLIDVRSAPYSRYSPQFNRESLENETKAAEIRYVFAGASLGGRPSEPVCYDQHGQISYPRVSEQGFYQTGIARLADYIGRWRTAIMCSEEDPNRCHRHKLISQTLLSRGYTVFHIRGDGRLESPREFLFQTRLIG